MQGIGRHIPLNHNYSMLFAILAGFLFALTLPVVGVWIKGRASLLASVVPLSLFGYFSSFLPEIASGATVTRVYEWAPSLGMVLGFRLDGLSMLFTLMITGIGSLVFLYTSAYLKGDPYLDRFYGYLSMFMAAMLGLVLSDNVVSLFLFWELTSITSFFLIGYKNNDSGSRRAALVALGVTGLGGMLLFAGLLMMASIAGTYSLQEMLASDVVFAEHGAYGLILLFVLGGAFTKSAQFPFHFWLPGAMKAPTPVSTYLHSATMVKAGVYLLFRMVPLLADHPWWHYSLMIAGGVTMLYSAGHALFRTDLKSILAYTTISALGILVFLIGLGTEEALLAAGVFILVHALYKATLFLMTGVLDHETGTRDVTRLRGLGRLMIPVAVAGMLAALSNAGVPPTLGFLGKDLIYEATLHMSQGALWLTAAAVLTKVLLAYAGYVVGVKPFLGKLPEEFAKVHGPGPLLWGPPLLLGLLCLAFGLFPGVVEATFARPILTGIGLGEFDFYLKLWHGFNTVLFLSLGTIGSGLVLYWLLKPKHAYERTLDRLESFSPLSLTMKLGHGFEQVSRLWTEMSQSGYLRYYIIIIIGFLVLIAGLPVLNGVRLTVPEGAFSEITFYEVIVLMILAVATGFVVFTESRLVAVAALGVVGFAISLIFVFYSAPDLAMTQFSIDTLTVILFVLVLYRLPRYLKLTNLRAKLRDGVLALTFGLMMTLLALEVLAEEKNRELANYFAENAYVLAKGKNVVNVILVDFRGTDTLVEITVLAIAAIGVYSLLKLKLSKNSNDHV